MCKWTISKLTLGTCNALLSFFCKQTNYTHLNRIQAIGVWLRWSRLEENQ